MSHSISEKILQFIHTVPIVECDDEAFNTLALQLFQYQFEKNAIYRAICQQQGLAPDRVTSWREIPAVTTSAFKEVPLTCFPPQEAVAVFHTSGTTQKRAGKHYFRTLDFYRAAMLRSFAAYCLDQQPGSALRVNNETLHDSLRDVIPEESFYNSEQQVEMKKDSSRMTLPFTVAKINKMRMFFLGPTAEHFLNSSLGYMFSEIRDAFGEKQSAVFFSPQDVEVDGFRTALEKASQENVPVFILGTALALWEAMEKFSQQNLKFTLPTGSRILDTGGYKGRRVEVARDEFQNQLCETFGVPREYLLNEYGMTELSSQFYASSLSGIPKRNERQAPSAMLSALSPQPSALSPRHFPPPWVGVAAVDPETLQILPEGEVGLLRIFDLANVDSVMAIQTEDLGRAWQDRLELVGRATGAELRGCSLLTESIVGNA
ncbi:hypothetical protein L0337_13945 [candidate division KSB1 bacterium]|nr:hypothetical protein [candidate division KSB1 bacterium]